MADTRSIEDRRAALLNAAGKVFLARGFEAATTLEIAREAKTSKRAIYEMFGSKEELLAALVAETSGRMAAPMALPEPETFDEFTGALEAFGRALLTNLYDEDRIAFYRLAIADAVRSGALARSIEAMGREPVADAFTDFMTAAVGHGLVAINDARLVAEVFIGTLVGDSHVRLLLGVIEPPEPAAIAARVEDAVEAVRRMVEAGR